MNTINTLGGVNTAAPLATTAEGAVIGLDGATIMAAQTDDYAAILDLLGFEGLPELSVAASAAVAETSETSKTDQALERTAASVTALAKTETDAPSAVPAGMVFIRAADAAARRAADRAGHPPVAAQAAPATSVEAEARTAVAEGNSQAQVVMYRSAATERVDHAAATDAADPLHGLPMDDCIQGHQEYHSRLTDILRGRTEAADADDSHSCPLGCWLDGEGRTLNRYREFGLLRQAHDRFHACAADIINRYQQGQLADAIRMLRFDLPKLADKIGEQALALQKAVRGF